MDNGASSRLYSATSEVLMSFYAILHAFLGFFTRKAVPFEGRYKIKTQRFGTNAGNPEHDQWYHPFMSDTEVKTWINNFYTKTNPGRQQSGKAFFVETWKLSLGGGYTMVNREEM